MVRALARRAEAEAVVVVHPIPVPPGLEGERCVEIAAECRAAKFDHLVVFKQAPEGAAFRICGRSCGDDEVRFRWLGVAPVSKVDMWVEGTVGGMTGRRGERGGTA